MREAIVIRTHFYDDLIDAFCRRLLAETGRAVIVACDEAKGEVALPADMAKASLTPALFAGEGLHYPNNAGWLCGDYFHYAARRAHPGFDRYWLVETDVRFKFDRLSEFFDHFAALPADLVAPQLWKAAPKWSWHAPMQPYVEQVHGCIFPVTRLSGQAIDLLLQERIRLSARWLEANAALEKKSPYPNDESFVASTLMARGLDCRDINKQGRVFITRDSFRVGRPMSHLALEAAPNDGLVYHPVHAGQHYLRKMKMRLSIEFRGGRPVEELQEFYGTTGLALIARECGEAGVAEFNQHFERLRQSAKAA
ncbi:hypothetical protein [Pseudoroseomonas cervicalis]|uniref:hypothetical protein n=1 Tax=Teichococcus cervicalis TaxID=204525 RepID=UPI002784F6F8|nr:hypothetical protein [Pseudoroseomonas cervicalis]MDQ1077668.1 hypothetical protein [Pseudoroseomonas cervicalis]